MKIFLSAASAQFRACRDALASDLRAVGAEVRVQEDFTTSPTRTLLGKLQDYIAECDRVVALLGDGYGAEPTGAETPAGRPRRSYTQWEYVFACGERIDGAAAAAKPLFAYFANAAFLAAHPAKDDDEPKRLQREFVAAIVATGKDRREFGSLDELRALVLRDGFRLPAGPKPKNLPFDSIGTLFKGRDEFLVELHRSLRSPSKATVVSTVHGLGGVGKSRLAVEYALSREAEYGALLFVMAETPEALQRNLAALCGPLVLNLPEKDAKEQDVQVGAALRWLQEHCGWLLIIDNVDTREAAEAVSGLVARLAGGCVLVTSRLADWPGEVDTLELDVLSEDAAVAFLLERTKDRRVAAASDDSDVRALAKELDGLALALEQAGAYVTKMRISFAEYLRRWRERDANVKGWHDARLMKYPRSVATTWDTSVAQLDAEAKELLEVLAWFAPEPIPREVFAADGSEDALARLAGLSLLKWETGNVAFRVHRLVQEVTRGRLAGDERGTRRRAAIGVIEAYLPGDPPPHDVRSWPRWEPMRSHVAVVVEHADAEGNSEAARLMNELALLLKAKCIWGEAESLFRRSLVIDERSYGPEHPIVAIRLNNLAQLLKATNRLDEAEPLMRRTLAIDVLSYGAEHPEVGVDLNNLASLLQATNRFAEAEPLMRRSLEIGEGTYGADHPNVAIELNNLAQLLQATDRLAEAEPLMRRALGIDERTNGPDHPTVATRLSNLAGLLFRRNRLAEAEPLVHRALDIDERRYGPDHPRVATRLGTSPDCSSGRIVSTRPSRSCVERWISMSESTALNTRMLPSISAT